MKHQQPLKEHGDGTIDRFYLSCLQIKLFQITAKAVIYQTFSQIPQKQGNSKLKGFLQAAHARHLCMNCRRKNDMFLSELLLPSRKANKHLCFGNQWMEGVP